MACLDTGGKVSSFQHESVPSLPAEISETFHCCRRCTGTAITDVIAPVCPPLPPADLFEAAVSDMYRVFNQYHPGTGDQTASPACQRAQSVQVGCRRTGQDRTGTGQDRTGQDGQDRTGQDRTGQDRTGQDGQDGQDRTGQDRTGQDRTGQDRTGRDGTGRDGTGRDGTGKRDRGQGTEDRGQGTGDRTGQDRTGQKTGQKTVTPAGWVVRTIGHVTYQPRPRH